MQMCGIYLGIHIVHTLSSIQSRSTLHSIASSYDGDAGCVGEKDSKNAVGRLVGLSHLTGFLHTIYPTSICP